MFWGISCDSGKRYSQNVNTSYHVSMASLETRDSSYAKKSVSLMVEHKNNEFLLCTLQYEHCMQVNLDLLFKKGEDVTFFLNGQGTVHLTGYLIDDYDDSIAPLPSDDGVPVMEDFEDSSIGLSRDNHKSRDHLKRSSLPTGNNEILEDDDDDDDDSDYVPTKDILKKKNERSKPKVNDRKADTDESDDDDKEEEDDDEDDEEDSDDDDEEEDDDDDENEEQQKEKVLLNNQKRKVQTTSENDSKRIKNANATDPQDSKDVAKSPKGQKPNVKESIPTISIEDEEDEEEEESDDEDSDEDSNEADEEEDMESSIGRTPMPPKRKDSLKKPGQVQMKLDFVPTPSATKNLTEKSTDPSVNKKKKKDKSIKALEKSFGKKLDGGVEIEDLRKGNGPRARKTRMVHISYVGRLPNNTVFDSCNDGKKNFAFRLGRGEVVKGLDVGIQGMRVGGKRKIKIPPSMGYGKKGEGPIPPNSTLYFTVELKAIT